MYRIGWTLDKLKKTIILIEKLNININKRYLIRKEFS